MEQWVETLPQKLESSGGKGDATAVPSGQTALARDSTEAFTLEGEGGSRLSFLSEDGGGGEGEQQQLFGQWSGLI